MTNEEAKAIIDKSLENGGWIPEADSFSFAELVRDALEKQIEAEKKPKRRIDTMTEYELSDLLYRYIEAKSRSCRECPVHGYCYVHPPVGCTRTVVRYLLSPAEEEKK